MRTITLNLTNEFDEAIAEGNSERQVAAAIGYFSMWAVHSERYASLSLYGDRRGDLHAQYRNKAGDITYTMLGQRGEDGSYSFHS